MSPPEKPTVCTLRAKLDALTKEISSITPVKVMTNPMHIQKTALLTAAMMGEMLVLIEGLTPYQDEAAKDD